MKTKKPRIVIRPWIPKKLPQDITASVLKETIASVKPKLEQVLYGGWRRIKIDGKRVTQFVLSTGKSSKEARDRFKKSEKYGEEIWIVEKTD